MSIAYLPERDILSESRHALADTARTLITHADRATLSGLGPTELLQFARGLEQTRNSLAAIDHALINALEDTHAAQVLTKRNTVTLVADTLNITRTDAHQRVEAATLLGDRSTLTG